MLKDLWTASEKPAFEFSDQVSLKAVVGETIDRLRESFAEKNIILENEIPESLPLLSVDKPKFYRLFELLLKDELATLPTGAKVNFLAKVLENRSGEKEVEIQLRDNGPGLPKEALRLVFDPFVVRSDSPTEYGIHLMACYFIVHHHGGRIDAKGAEGQGTVFTIRLPVNPARSPSVPEGDTEFLQKVLLSDTLWEKLISTD